MKVAWGSSSSLIKSWWGHHRGKVQGPLARAYRYRATRFLKFKPIPQINPISSLHDILKVQSAYSVMYRCSEM